MNLYEVDFKGMWPVGNCLILKAKDLKEAKKIASETITHTDVFTIKKVDMSKAGVVVYLSGDY